MILLNVFTMFNNKKIENLTVKKQHYNNTY